MSNRVLIIGDSMALPRENVTYEETWPSIIQHKFKYVEFINRSLRGSTVERLTTEGQDASVTRYPPGSDCLEFYNPTIIILQLGVVDCAPRLLNKKGLLSKIITRLPIGLKSKVISVVKKCRGRRTSFAYIKPSEYRKHIENYIQRCFALNVKKVFAIKIGTISDLVAKESPNFTSQIEIYNKILNDISVEYDYFTVIDTGVDNNYIEEHTVDGYHLNALGHSVLSSSIESKLNFELFNET